MTNKKWLLFAVAAVTALLTVHAISLLAPEIHDVFVISRFLSKQGVLLKYLPDSLGFLYPSLFWATLAGLAWAACYTLYRKPLAKRNEE